jgi:hypothetical protein
MSTALSPHFWRRSEVETLRREYPRGGSKRVASLLPHRTPGAIKMRAAALGLKSGFYWTADEVARLQAEYPRLGLDRMPDLLPGRSRDAIKHKVDLLGLRRHRRGNSV